MVRHECVREDELRALALGELPEPLADAVARHLDACPHCEAAAQRLERAADPFIRGLRRDLTSTTDGETVNGLSAPPIARASGLELAGYEILEEIGRGGMSVVYRARQRNLQRLVALKMVLAERHADPEQRARFLLDGEAIARLRHPNVVQILEVGAHDGMPFLALEYVGGGNLACWLAAHTPEPRTAAALVETLARAVQYAHEQGIIHRDLKPANILLEPTTGPDAGLVPRITDFGLAKRDGQELTSTGAILGTPAYMAPEQAIGANALVGRATDIHALGVILYELLTGAPPFRGTSALETLEQVRSADAVTPSQVRPQVPRDLSIICLKCLHKEPARRYATALALADDLRRYLDGKPIQARPVGTVERALSWARRNRGRAALLTTVAGLLLVVAVGAWVVPLYLDAALTQARAAERQARLSEADALVGLARGTRYSRRSGRRFEALAALGKAAALGRELDQPAQWFDRLRNEAIAALALPDLHITRAWDGWPQGTTRVALSPDFSLYARATEQGGCSIRQVSDDKQIASLPDLGEPAAWLQFGPGRQVVLIGATSGRCQLWDLRGAKPICRVDDGLRGVHHGTFRADGSLLALSRTNGSVGVYDTGTGACRYHLAAGAVTQEHVSAVHPTEPVVASCSYQSHVVQLRDLNGGGVLVSVPVPWRGARYCAWSPDGRTLAVSEGDGGEVQLYGFDPQRRGLEPRRTRLRGPCNGGGIVCFNPAGDRLAVRGWNEMVTLFDVHTGRQLFATASLTASDPAGLGFDITGRRLAAARCGPGQEQIGLWSVADGREYRATEAHNCPPDAHDTWRLHVHRKGRLAAQAFVDGVALFDLETGHQAAFLAGSRFWGGVWFDASTGDLLTNSAAGCFRWPVRPDPARSDRVVVGPPRRLPFNPGTNPIASSKDGRVIAQSMYGSFGMQAFAGGWVLHPGAAKPSWVDRGVALGWTSVSPDGRWVAFGAFGTRVNVYEAATGRRAFQSPAGAYRNDYCRFSPDGRWLVTNADGGRAYAVDSWERGPRLGPGIPWDISPDSRLVVLAQTDGIYRLVELATGRELARLDDPDQLFGTAVFTPDGTRLVVAAADGLRIWDLRRIRSGLAELQLDWQAPPYAPVPDAPPARLEVSVDLGELR